MEQMKILPGKEIREIRKLIKEQWGADFETDCGFLMRGDDVFIVTKEINRIELNKLRMNSLGMYFGELSHDELRLSIEGSQLVGPIAKKNVAELNEEEARRWLMGNELEKEIEAKGFLIIKHNNDFMGCAKAKNGKLLNHVPKARRIGE